MCCPCRPTVVPLRQWFSNGGPQTLWGRRRHSKDPRSPASSVKPCNKSCIFQIQNKRSNFRENIRRRSIMRGCNSKPIAAHIFGRNLRITKEQNCLGRTHISPTRSIWLVFVSNGLLLYTV
uniref:Putative endonucle n=1 Tax=Ixodes ricinus TaxID=34613 RepID=A0A0K8RBH0_IXORI